LAPASVSLNDRNVCRKITLRVQPYLRRWRVQLVGGRRTSETNPSAPFTRLLVSVLGTATMLCQVSEVGTIEEDRHTIGRVFIDRIRGMKT
jgi:hypothetical protein